ncbi:MAG: SDR family NAD(P)-dependent oxidoreductase [Sandaracinaceae bacterium]|nr:SDR family NAD(P)-dependent oxidoreductase [Sandaracinaceae bacterium]
MSEGPLEGKVVAVVGGGRGVGRAHALACARAGAAGVLVNDLGCDVRGRGADPGVAAEVARQIEAELGVPAEADAEDVGARGGPERIVAHAVSRFGRLDALIGCAGLVADATVLKLDEDDLRRMLDVVVLGAFGLVRAGARAMIDGGEGGAILLHTGPVGFFGAARQAALAASSAAVVGLVRSAAVELRKHRVRVNALAPTARTRTTEELPLFRTIAPGSMGPELVGPVGAFLVSPRAADVSGEVVGVAGTRIYALHGRETPGWFGDGEPPSFAAIERAWAELTRS